MELKKEHDRLIDDYEQLLEDLPQDKYSKAGTPPELVIKEVEENTYIKTIVNDDVSELIEGDCTVEDLRKNLKEYFEI